MVSTAHLARTHAVVYARCERLWVMILVAPPKLDDMLAARATLETMKREVSGTFPTLTWITTAAGFSMDQDARRAASDITRDFGDVIAAQATVIETGGFQGAAVRMIISGMDLVAGTRSPTKTFATLEECIPWCQLFNAAPGVADADIVAAVAALARAP